jgi:hypothetical protein
VPEFGRKRAGKRAVTNMKSELKNRIFLLHGDFLLERGDLFALQASFPGERDRES